MHRRFHLLAWALLAGCTAAGPQLGASQEPIVNGTVDSADPAVVALTFQGQDFCTGTLVDPRVVVTAAHCADASETGLQVNQISIFFGNQVGKPGETIRVIGGQVHPQWNSGLITNDIACLLLERPASVAPVPMSSTPFDSTFVGQTIRLVGFGVTSATASLSGVKREATTTIELSPPPPCEIAQGFPCSTAFTNTAFYYDTSPGQTCYGDSGGPAFMTIDGQERLIGVTSWGDQDCTVFGIDTRVDAFRDFVQNFIAANVDHCPDDGVCQSGCSPVDPDCGPTCNAGDGCDTDCAQTDPDCPNLPAGDKCTSATDCHSGECLPAPDEPALSFCSQSCTSDDDCPAGIGGAKMVCVAASSGGKVCLYPAPSPGALGSICTVATDCKDNVCQPDGMTSICTRACDPASASSCPDGFSCQKPEQLDVCLPKKDSGGGGCSAAPGSTGGAAGLLVLLCLVVRRRRR